MSSGGFEDPNRWLNVVCCHKMTGMVVKKVRMCDWMVATRFENLSTQINVVCFGRNPQKKTKCRLLPEDWNCELMLSDGVEGLKLWLNGRTSAGMDNLSTWLNVVRWCGMFEHMTKCRLLLEGWTCEGMLSDGFRGLNVGLDGQLLNLNTWVIVVCSV